MVGEEEEHKYSYRRKGGVKDGWREGGDERWREGGMKERWREGCKMEGGRDERWREGVKDVGREG